MHSHEPNPRPRYVYFARCGDLVKIGQSVEPYARVRELRTSSPGRVVLLAFVASRIDFNEYVLHRRFQHLRVHGEWFNVDHDLAGIIAPLVRDREIEQARRRRLRSRTCRDRPTRAPS